ncbi:toxin glutamine deamidase domain-containing protein [Dactylosporangium sp. CA-233914]|uniref:WXG100-like domain-containing protein n=1 Tax=Dactylosporangium sp. CA-233914 TaxID=3239934 RepID=UPI003D914561
MSVQKPDLHPLDWLWDAICIIGGGSAWPEGDEDKLRDLGHAWQDLATELNGLLNNADTIAMQISQAWGGDAGEAFNTYWSALAVGPEHGLPQVADIALNYSAAAENAAMEIEYAKLVLVITLVITLITVIICQVLAAFTFGGSEAAAGAAVATARTIAGRVLQRLVQWLGKGIIRKLFTKFVIHEVQQIAFSVGADFLAQEIQIAEGTRKELDTHSLLNSLVSGAITGALTFPLNFVHLPIKSRLPRVAANAGVHAGANALIMPASMMLTTGFMTGDWSWKNITQGISLESFLNGAAMGGTMGGLGALRSPHAPGTRGGETPHLDGETGRPGERGAGETVNVGEPGSLSEGNAGDVGVHGGDSGATGDTGVTGTGDRGATGDSGNRGATGDGGVTAGDRGAGNVGGSDYTAGDGQSLAPTSDTPAGGSVTAPVDSTTTSNAHGNEPVTTHTGDPVTQGGGDPVTRGGGDPVTQRGGEPVTSGGGEPVTQRAADTGSGSSGGSYNGADTRTTTGTSGGGETGIRAGGETGSHVETGTHIGQEGGAQAGHESGGRTGQESGAAGDRTQAVAGGPLVADRPAGVDGARTTDATGRTTDATGRTADATGRTTDAAGRTTDGTGRTTDATGRTTDATGRTTDATGRTTDGTGRTTDASGRTTEGTGRHAESGRGGEAGRSGEGARSGERSGDGARTTDGGRTAEQNRTNGSIRAPERAGEAGARPGETGSRPGEHVRVGEGGARTGEHVPVRDNGGRPGEPVPVADHGGRPGEHVPVGDHGTRAGDHVQVGEQGSRAGEHVRVGENESRAGENGSRAGEHVQVGESGGRAGEHVQAGENGGRAGEHAPVRDGGGGEHERGGEGGRHRAEEPAAVFVPLPRVDDMPVRVGGSDGPGGHNRPVSVHEGTTGGGERGGGGRGTDTLPGRESGTGGERGEGPAGGGDDNPPPGDRPGGGGGDEHPPSKLSTTESAEGTRSYEGPPQHFEGDPGSPEGRAAVDKSARDLADAVRDQMEDEGLGKKNRVRVAGALLTPEDPTVTSHTSARPMKHGDGSTTELQIHPEARRVLDEIKAAAEHDPDKRVGQNHGKCAEVVLVSDRLYELERQWNEQGRPGGDFPAYAREQMRDGVVSTHWIGDGSRQEHGDFAPPCDSCGPFIKDFGIESVDPHGTTGAHEPAVGPHEPTGGEHATGEHGTGAGEHETGTGRHEEQPPDTVGKVGDGRTVAETRPGEHIDPPAVRDVRALEDAFPHDKHGNPQRHPDPRIGDWAQKVNDGGVHEPGRNNNCPDVAMAVLANHYGEPTVAGSMRDPIAGGEHNGAQRIAEWTRGEWSMDGRDASGLGRVEQQLRDAGPGSAAVVVIKWADSGEGHAFNALRIGRDIVWVDMQRGLISDHGPMYHDNVGGVWSITLDAHGEPIVPGLHDVGGHAPGTGDVTGAKPHQSGEPAREFKHEDLSEKAVQRGTQIDMDLYRGPDDRLHIPGDMSDTQRAASGLLQDHNGDFIKDWHTAERQNIAVQAVEGEARPHELRSDTSFDTDPVQGVHDSSQTWHDAQDRAHQATEARNQMVKDLNEDLGLKGRSAYKPEQFEPGKTFKETIEQLKDNPNISEARIKELEAAVDRYHNEVNNQAKASGEAGMHAGLGVARESLFNVEDPSILRPGQTEVPPETVHVLGDPKSATPGELDIIALRWDGEDAPAGFNRLDLWEAKGGSADLGSKYFHEFNGKAEQGTGPYLKWMLENDPHMLKLFKEHPGLLEGIRDGSVTVEYHKVTTSVERAVIDPETRQPVRDPVTGQKVIDQGSSTTKVNDFSFEGKNNEFHPEKIDPNWKALDKYEEAQARAAGEPLPRLGSYDPQYLHGVDVTEGGRAWHAELPPALAWPGADPHAVQTHVRGLLEGAADPRTWVDGQPPRIVVHAEHGIDAATARLIEHTRIDFQQPSPENPIAGPRVVVEGPRLHGDPIHLPEAIVADDRAGGVPYFNAEQQARATVRVVDGLLYDHEGLPLDGEYIYAVDPHTQEIHAVEYGRDNAKHSSLFAGGDIDAAGSLIVDNGRIVIVDNHSGHYTPVAEHVSRARDAFVLHGADLGSADFRVTVGHGTTEFSSARGEHAFDQAVAELRRPGEFDGVVDVRRLAQHELMDRAGGTSDTAVVRVELADGRVIDVDATGVRDFLRAARPDGPDAHAFNADRITRTTDADLAFQGADQLRERIEGVLEAARPGRFDDAPAPRDGRPARPDHVLTELDRLLAERLGQQPLHDHSGEAIPPPRDGRQAVGTLRNLTDEHIRRLVDTAGLPADQAAFMVGDLVARRDAVIDRFGSPPNAEEIQRMTGVVRDELGYRRDMTGRDLYDLLREQAHRKTGEWAHGMTVYEAARAVDAAIAAEGGQPRYERMLGDYLDTAEGRAHHDAMTELDLATSHSPRYDLIDERFQEPSPEYVAEHSAGHAAEWTPQQHEAIRRYAGGGGSGVEHFLRTGETTAPANRADAFRIQDTMRESGADLRLHAGIDIRQLGIRETTELPGLVDGTVTMDTFTRLGATEHDAPVVGNVTVIVEAPRGTPMVWIGGVGEHAQGHALLPAGARLHVLELNRTGYEHYELRLRYEGYDDPAALTGRLHDDGPPPGDLPPHYDVTVPMTTDEVHAVANRHGVDLRGVEIRLADPQLARYMDEQGVAAIAPPEEGGRVLVLGPAAFADHETLAATLGEHGRGPGDPLLGGEDVRLARPGSDDLGYDAGGRHRAGDDAGRWDRGPGEGAGDRGGEPAGPAGGVGDPGRGVHDAEPGGAGRGAGGGGDPAGGVHVSRDAGHGDGRGGHPGDETGFDYRAGDIAAILGGEPAAGIPGDHPGAGGAAPAGGGHDHAVRAGAAADPAAANLAAHQLVQERIAPHSPELAGVLEKLLDDPHALNVTNSLRNPELREVVLINLEELARGDALASYGGDLHAFLEDNPGRGPLYDNVPEWVNRAEGAEQTRMQQYVAELKDSDPALNAGANPSEAQMAGVRAYADRLTTELKPEVDRQLQAIAEQIQETTDGPVDYNSRAKDADGLIDKVGRMSRGRPGAAPRDWYRVGDIIDAVGARITVPDTASLWRTLQAVVHTFGVGDGGRIVEVDNMYASPKSKSPAYRVIPLCIGIEVNGHKYAFELQLTTLRASIAADIEHNSLYKPYVALSQADAEAVRRAFEEAAALDQLEGT